MNVRQAKPSDLDDLIVLLSQLTTVGNPSNIDQSVYGNIYVATLSDKIVGTITLIIEPKIIHNGSSVGHIEDVVVNKDFRNKGIGKLLIDYVVEIARKAGCYKVILDCDENNVNFYQKSGFKTSGICMRLDM